MKETNSKYDVMALCIQRGEVYYKNCTAESEM